MEAKKKKGRTSEKRPAGTTLVHSQIRKRGERSGGAKYARNRKRKIPY